MHLSLKIDCSNFFAIIKLDSQDSHFHFQDSHFQEFIQFIAKNGFEIYEANNFEVIRKIITTNYEIIFFCKKLPRGKMSTTAKSRHMDQCGLVGETFKRSFRTQFFHRTAPLEIKSVWCPSTRRNGEI